jgi:hypothetical protein
MHRAPSVTGLHVVLHDTEGRKVGSRRHRADAGSGVHANNEDTEDLESHVPVAGGLDRRAPHKGCAEDRARRPIAFLAIDGTNGCLPIPAVERNVPLHLLLGLTDQGITHFDIRSIKRTIVPRLGWKAQQHRNEARRATLFIRASCG